MSNERSFVRALREHVNARANLIAKLTQHGTLLGTSRERAVIDMLRSQLPRRYEVLSGTVLLAEEDDGFRRGEHQFDVMVVDTFDYPTLLRDGDIAVVLPEAVRVVIEVKSDLDTPPDPEKPSSSSEDEAANKKRSRTSKPKETFLEALKQVARLRRLFSDRAPIHTILLSYEAPANNPTLRGWMKRIEATRAKRASELDRFEKGSNLRMRAEEELSLLEPSLMPDVIIADNGALAQRDANKYDYFAAGPEGGKPKSSSAPGLVVLVSHVVAHLERHDPVLQLMRLDSRLSELVDLRGRAHDLFMKVMRPVWKPDEGEAGPAVEDVAAATSVDRPDVERVDHPFESDDGDGPAEGDE